MSTPLETYKAALSFVTEHHPMDLERVRARLANGLVESFEDFFHEYCYVVVASGFKGATAARLAPQLETAALSGQSLPELLTIFKNKSKVNAIHKMSQKSGDIDFWISLRSEIASSADPVATIAAQKLPYIGTTTAVHLARNIGAESGRAKPDLHLLRWAERCGSPGPEGVQKLVAGIAEEAGDDAGAVDFCLWIWFTHSEGQPQGCCGRGDAGLR